MSLNSVFTDDIDRKHCPSDAVYIELLLLKSSSYRDNNKFNDLLPHKVYWCNETNNLKVEEIKLIKIAITNQGYNKNILIYKDQNGYGFSRNVNSFLSKCFISEKKARLYHINHIKFRLNQEVTNLGFSNIYDVIELINDFDEMNPEYAL